jgi:hypothetical protein
LLLWARGDRLGEHGLLLGIQLLAPIWPVGEVGAGAVLVERARASAMKAGGDAAGFYFTNILLSYADSFGSFHLIEV